MRKKTYLLLTFLTITLLCTINAYASQNVVLLTGNITDENGKSIGINLFFTDMNGKKIQTRVNSNDGFYQQVLPQGEKFVLGMKGYILVGDNTYTSPSSSEYLEIKKDFTIKKIETGMLIDKLSPFDENKSELNANKALFMYVKSFLSNNINTSIVITVHTHDSHFKPTKKKETVTVKGKNKTKTITVSADEQLKQLGNERIEAIKTYFRSLNIIVKNCTFILDTKPLLDSPKKESKKKGKKSEDTPVTSSNPTVYITVGKIMNM